jgi:hypothetical protein
MCDLWDTNLPINKKLKPSLTGAVNAGCYKRQGSKPKVGAVNIKVQVLQTPKLQIPYFILLPSFIRRGTVSCSFEGNLGQLILLSH